MEQDLDPRVEKELKQAALLIAQAQSVVAFTGAGISVESGIPDFRSPGGLWSKYDPRTYCDYRHFLEQPQLFWEMAKEMHEEMRNAVPNAAHMALARMEREGFLSSIITQNVDNLHQQAGSQKVFELHGNAIMSTCTACSIKAPTVNCVAQAEVVKVPKCSLCDGVMKMDVILFGETMPSSTLQDAMQAAALADVLLVIGTSLKVSPANMMVNLCRQQNGHIVIIDPDSTLLRKADVMLCGPAGTILPRLSEMASHLRYVSKAAKKVATSESGGSLL
ncbi:hypothetical protein CY35_04G044800 [Sphagnum magellanicum]|nr:hypothetical protein CY35_04G044800 [Sphagnum magellanicum]